MKGSPGKLEWYVILHKEQAEGPQTASDICSLGNFFISRNLILNGDEQRPMNRQDLQSQKVILVVRSLSF